MTGVLESPTCRVQVPDNHVLPQTQTNPTLLLVHSQIPHYPMHRLLLEVTRVAVNPVFADHRCHGEEGQGF